MALQIKSPSHKTLGPARLRSDDLHDPFVSPRRVFRHLSYPKRITKKAASYLNNIQALFATYVPWVSHVHLCMYHIWALIWELSRPWRSPVWHALLAYKPFLYCIHRQWCFFLDWIRRMLCSHNWRGALAQRSSKEQATKLVSFSNVISRRLCF